MKKFKERMQGVLPVEELPLFFSALESMGAKPRKSMRIRRDLPSEAKARWTPDKFREAGVPLADRVSWYDHGYFFDLGAMKPHPSRHPVIASGLGFIQEAGAMEVVPALAVERDHLVLDLCAAPGAKSTHIGEYLGSEGWLVAAEPVRERAKLLEAILARHGIGNSTVYNLEPHRLAEFFPEVFDRILIDAPCSGESLFAKREEKRKDVTHKEVERCALRQDAILKNGARMLAPGGRLVYSTCAYSRTENEEVVEAFLASHPDFVLAHSQRRFPHRDGVPGGYFAVLEKSKSEGEDRKTRFLRLREAVRAIGSKGLVRDGLTRWDGHPDPYATAMDRKTDARSEGVTLESLELAAASALLAGTEKPHLPNSEGRSVVYVWEGERIAAAAEGVLYYPRGRLH